MRSASEKDSAPAGTSMNSWKSSEFWACAPPLITFSIGTGSTCAFVPPIQRYSGTSASAAAAFATASETPRMAFAPRRAFVSVPSSSIMAASSARCSRASSPRMRSAISPFTWATARPTPFPAHASPPSRSSTASCSPVEAPEGTAAAPNAPESRPTSTSTVGLPRESSTWRPWTWTIELTALI